MNLTKLLAFLILAALSWTIYALWVLTTFDGKHFLLHYALISGYWLLPGGILLLAYSAFLIYRLLPKVDPIVDPEAHSLLQRHEDLLFHRIHRLLMYSGSASSRWLNGRVQHQYDFSTLPKNLRFPLRAHFLWLCLMNFFMFSGFAAFEVIDLFGLER